MAFKLPSITSAIPRDLRAFCDRVREALNAQGNDRIVTRRDLIATGVVIVGPGNTLQPTDPTEIAKKKYDTPPTPTGLATSGAIANIILTWDAPNYPGHSYTEVYVSDTNTFTDRVKLADVPGSTYSHSVGASTTKYYWIRFVNVAEVPGPYNSTTSVSGTTGDDPDYLISVLSDAYGVTGDGLFFQIDSPTVINGVTIPAGTYIKQAIIADATIARAKIQDLAVDNAKIADLNANKITAGSMQVGSYIQSSNFITGVQGWKIDAAGAVEFGSGTFRGALSGATGTFSGTVTASTFNTATSGQRVELSSSTNDLRIYNSSGTLVLTAGGLSTNTYVKAINGITGPAIWGQNTSNAPGVYGSSSGSGEGVYGQSSSGYGVYGLSTTAEGVRGRGTNSSGASHGVRGINTATDATGFVGGANGFDFYADGAGTNYGPFTGTHDALTDPNDGFTIGDIVVDSQLVRRNGISSAITLVNTSTQTNQKAAIGVVCNAPHPFEDNIPAVYMSGFDAETGEPIPTAEYAIDKQTYNLVAVNALGEGQINVCGEGGNIEAGDLIVTSSLPGKGMKQDDDLIRSYTVAKARESVTFASPTEVKQIACIYLCG